SCPSRTAPSRPPTPGTRARTRPGAARPRRGRLAASSADLPRRARNRNLDAAVPDRLGLFARDVLVEGRREGGRQQPPGRPARRGLARLRRAEVEVGEGRIVLVG